MSKESLKKNNNLNYSVLSEYRASLLGLAAIFIPVYHSTGYISESGGHLLELLGFFNIGVEIFLLLSGIGLYYSYMKKPSFRDYYAKRVISVWIPSVITTFLPVLYHYIFVEKWSTFRFLSSLFDLDFILRFSSSENRPIYLRTLWYIPFIMILYAVYPLIFKAIQKLGKFHLIFCAAFIIVWICLCSALNKKAHGWYSFYELAICRVPVFILGCSLGKMVYEHKNFTYRTWLFVVFGFLMYFVVRHFQKYISFRYQLLLLSFSVCVLFCVILKILKWKWLVRFFSFFGSFSLELYLIHNAIREFCFTKNQLSLKGYVIICLASVPIAWAFSKLRRLIVNKYKERKNINKKGTVKL